MLISVTGTMKEGEETTRQRIMHSPVIEHLSRQTLIGFGPITADTQYGGAKSKQDVGSMVHYRGRKAASAALLDVLSSEMLVKEQEYPSKLRKKNEVKERRGGNPPPRRSGVSPTLGICSNWYDHD